MHDAMKMTRWLAALTFTAVILTYVVIAVGAYTRLTYAGLGCPDWPGCYGHMVVPSDQKTIQAIDAKHPKAPIVIQKARTEMLHRYVAGALGLFVFGIAVLSAFISVQRGFRFLLIAVALCALLVYQVVLGLWTVTLLLLPVIVTQHLMGAMLILSLLWLLHLRSREPHRTITPDHKARNFRFWAMFCLIAVFLQIMLGAWTSANYAGLICHGFPYCRPATNLPYDFTQAFNVMAPVGVNYEGGVLSSAARMTIQVVHRWGAFVVFVSIMTLILFARLKLKSDGRIQKNCVWLLMLLIVQIILGVANVMLQMPLWIAIAHNLVAATLLIVMVAFNSFLYEKPRVKL